MRKVTQGFSLVEIMIVVAIVSLLVTVVVFNVQPAGQKARDAQRQADLREVQSALEQYKNRYGRYPEGCNGFTLLDVNAGTPSNIKWSGELGAEDACDDPDEPYILGAPGRLFSQFLQPLPTDPRLNGNNSGYRYTTNEEGTVYKFMAKNTVEADDLSYDHPFKSCDRTYDLHLIGSQMVKDDLVANGYGRMCDPVHMSGANPADIQCDIGICDRLYTSINYNSLNNSDGSYLSMPHCVDGNAQFESSYAIWGGVSHMTTNSTAILNRPDRIRVHIERQTENIICRLP